MEIARVVETRYVIGHGQLHDAVMLLFQIERPAPHSQQIRNPRFELFFVQRADEHIIDHPPQMAARHAALASNRKQQKWEKYRLLGTAPGPDLRAQLPERRSIDNRQVKFFFQRSFGVWQQNMIRLRKPFLEPMAILL